MRLSVNNNNGTAVRSAIAELLDHLGRVVQTRPVQDGHAEFCDFGFGEHAIRVHGTTTDCAATVVEDIRIQYGFTLELGVIFNTCPYEGDREGNACFTFARIQNPQGQPLEATEISDTRSGYKAVSDTYGRAQLAVPIGKEADYVFAKEGYRPLSLHMGCPSFGRWMPEAVIILIPTSGKPAGDKRQ